MDIDGGGNRKVEIYKTADWILIKNSRFKKMKTENKF